MSRVFSLLLATMALVGITTAPAVAESSRGLVVIHSTTDDPHWCC